MSPEILYKDPEDVILKTFDWTHFLFDDAVVQGTNTWSVSPSGPTFSAQTILSSGLKTSALISGGAAGKDYIVTNRVTTSDGQTIEESGTLRVEQSSS